MKTHNVYNHARNDPQGHTFVYSLLLVRFFGYLSMVKGRFNYTGKVFHKFGKGSFLYMCMSTKGSNLYGRRLVQFCVCVCAKFVYMCVCVCVCVCVRAHTPRYVCV